MSRANCSLVFSKSLRASVAVYWAASTPTSLRTTSMPAITPAARSSTAC